MMPNVGSDQYVRRHGHLGRLEEWSDRMSLGSVKENAVLYLEWDNSMQQNKVGTDYQGGLKKRMFLACYPC